MMGHKPNNVGLGNLTGLKPIISNPTNTTNTTTTTTTLDLENDKEFDDDITTIDTYYSKIMRITPQTYERLREYSHKYHNQPISYDEIFQELLDFYNEKHEVKYF